MVKIQKVLIHKGHIVKDANYGVVGSSIPNTTYKVGDLVYWESESYESSGNGIICYNIDSDYKHPFIMGLASQDVRIPDSYHIKSLVVPANLVTKEIIEYHRDSMTIIEKEIKQVTIDEIRQYVPFEFELVN